MKWEPVFAKAADGEHQLTLRMYGTEGMFTVTLDDLSESDLTEDEAKLWLWDHLTK